jgi:hypothetical protein
MPIYQTIDDLTDDAVRAVMAYVLAERNPTTGGSMALTGSSYRRGSLPGAHPSTSFTGSAYFSVNDQNELLQQQPDSSYGKADERNTRCGIFLQLSAGGQ